MLDFSQDKCWLAFAERMSSTEYQETMMEIRELLPDDLREVSVMLTLMLASAATAGGLHEDGVCKTVRSAMAMWRAVADDPDYEGPTGTMQ